MLASLIVVFRETIEAGLIVGIVLAATRGVAGRNRFVGAGILAGVIGACILALFTDTISSSLEGMGQEMLNVTILSLAVTMLIWHIVWMARHGREMAAEMKAVGTDVALGNRPLTVLALVVGTAVLREGAETVLFLYGIAASGNDSNHMMLMGGALGLGAGVILAALMYQGLLKIPVRYFFQATSWLIALLAAGMASQAALFLQQAQVVTVLEQTLWDSSAMISDSSILGKVLHTLVGYTAQPSALQIAVYVAVLVLIYVLQRLVSKTPMPAPRGA
jgi:high-affinity iron transporter